jgi:hypothetical protein
MSEKTQMIDDIADLLKTDTPEFDKEYRNFLMNPPKDEQQFASEYREYLKAIFPESGTLMITDKKKKPIGMVHTWAGKDPEEMKKFMKFAKMSRVVADMSGHPLPYHKGPISKGSNKELLNPARNVQDKWGFGNREKFVEWSPTMNEQEQAYDWPGNSKGTEETEWIPTTYKGKKYEFANTAEAQKLMKGSFTSHDKKFKALLKSGLMRERK